MASQILNLSCRSWWVVSVTPRQLYSRRRTPVGRHRACLDPVARRNVPTPPGSRIPVI